MKLKPIGDKIIIKKLKAEERTSSGIVLTGSAKEEPQHATVVAIGPDILSNDEKSEQINVGDTVVYTKYSGSEIKVDEDELIVCKLSDILAIIEK